MISTKEIIEKVQKLLSLSKSSNANEAAAAAAKANELLDKHRLSLADLETSIEEDVEVAEEDNEYLYQTGRTTPWKVELANVLTEHYGVIYYNEVAWKNGRHFTQYRMVGRPSDMSIVKYMYAWLSMEVERLSKQEAKGKGRVYVGSYQKGFVAGVASQLRLSRIEIRKEASSSALVKIDARGSEAEAMLQKLHPKLKYVEDKSSVQINYHAFGLGKKRGEEIHLGTSLSGGEEKTIRKLTA